MVERYNGWRRQFDTWLESKPEQTQKVIKHAIGFGILAALITIGLALRSGNQMSEEQLLVAPVWIRGVHILEEFIVFVAIGAFVFYIARALITQYVGSGDQSAGWKRFGVSAAITVVALRLLHTGAFIIWTMTPAASELNQVAARYDDMCTVDVQDGDNSGHTEDDWHAGVWACGSLKHRLNALYPGPAWLFGAPPKDD